MSTHFALPSPEAVLAMDAPVFAISSAVRSSDEGERCGDMIAHRYLADGTLALVIVDVAGRGRSCAALADYVTTHVLGLLASQCRLGQAARIAEHDFSCEDTHGLGQFVTVFAALISPRKRCLQYVSAGHETAIVLSRDRSHRHLETTGPAFGILTRPRYPIASCRFASGDELIVVTDGITDARDEHGIPFGSGGVVRTALHAASRGEDPARSLIDAASRHATFALDDRSSIVVTYPHSY